ncbi:MAG: MoaD/ThiS family protein [Armatimonadetes bacterium]|jgi:molybdopterin synthase sulfur carrier subunit|nr:MoaD/ThiS family protein [Armatimonadota bacterium]
MPAVIKLPTPLRRHTNHQKSLNTAAGSVKDALDELVTAFPGVQGSLYDESGELKSFVRVFVDGRDIQDLDGLATPLRDGAVLSIVPPVAGA